MLDDPRSEVHDSEDMLKPHVLGRREDPPGGLELMDLPHPLDPRMVDQLLFGDLPLRQSRPRDERDVAVDRIVSEALRGVVTRHEAGGCEDLGNRIQDSGKTGEMIV